jgi:GT2 family glycosyltransferase
VIEAVVAIPVRNEEERIGACLGAIGAQAGLAPGALGIALLVNNTTDGTVAAIEAARTDLPHAVRVVVRDSPDANAGWARRGAMDAAAEWLEESGGRGAILTTDADSRVSPDWAARNIAALAGGADAVAGTISLDPADAARLSPALQARGRLEAEYHALLDELAALVDPDPQDPWPNHTTESGASLAVTLAAYRQVGGMPPIALGDDRAFMARLREHDLRIRHDPAIRVVTSGRLAGRAAGGVADTMRARQDDPDCLCDARLEPFDRALRRLRWRRRLRLLHGGGRLARNGRWPRLLGISSDQAEQLAARRRTGEVVAAAEEASAALRAAPLRPSELAGHIARARRYISERRGGSIAGAA